MADIDYRAPPLAQQISLLTKWLPSGRIWRGKFDRGRILGRLVEAFARQIQRTSEQVELLHRELDPAAAYQLLLEHEESVGIPDKCFGRANTVEERRRRILQKLNRFGDPITKEQIEAILADFGEAIEIVPGNEENAELLGFPAGPYDAGQRAEIFHTVAVRVESGADTFPFDFPFTFTGASSSLVECLVDRLLPANVEILFFYNQDLNVPFLVEDAAFFGTNVAPFVEDDVDIEPAGQLLEVAPFVEDVIAAQDPFFGTNVAPFVEDEVDVELASNVVPLDTLVDLGTSISETAAGSKSFAAGDNRQAVYIQFIRGLADVDRQVTYGNQNMVSRADFRSGTTADDVRVRIWTLGETGLAAAEDNVFRVVGATSGVRYRAVVGSYQNCDQTTPVLDSDGDVGEDPSITGLATASGGRVIAATAQSDDNETTAWSADVAEIDDIQETLMSYSFADGETDGTTVDVTADNSGADVLDQALAVISLQPA